MAVGVLVVGAHPDDIEIAAGGTVVKLLEAGAHVVAVVATDELDAEMANARRKETKRGLRSLGVSTELTVFLGLPDGSTVVDGRSSGLLTRELARLEFAPDVVITHSMHDRHPDHRNVSQIVQSAVGDGPLSLGMAVVNSVADAFAPELFVETSAYADAKAESLAAHCSQVVRGRIWSAAISEFEQGYAQCFDVDRVEPFELLRPLSPADDHTLSSLQRCFTRVVAG